MAAFFYLRSSESNDFGDLFFVPIGGYGILQGVQRSPLHQPNNPVLVWYCCVENIRSCGLRYTNQAIPFKFGISACKTSVAEVSGLRSNQ